MKPRRLGKVILSTLVIVCLTQMISAQSETEVVKIKSDSTWKASSTVSTTDWFKLDFEDSSWESSVGRWPNNPCTRYCGKMTSCELSCIDWMWYDQSCATCETYYRKTINLPEEVISAKITMTADNYYWLYVNGNFVGSDTRRIAYTTTMTYDITSYMLPGKNVIAIKAQNNEEYEGVALTGEIKYKTYNTLINQLQTQIDSLEEQLNALSNDKNRLEEQVDTLQTENMELTNTKDELTNENSVLKIENLGLTAENDEVGRHLDEAESSISTYTILNVVLILGLLVTLGALVATIYYFYNRTIGRKPRLSSPKSRMPSEEVKLEEGPTHLSDKELEDMTPIFDRKKGSKLSEKWLK